MPPERIVVFVDRSLGRGYVADALRAAGVDVVLHDDHFDQHTLDVEWLPAVASRGWIVLTKDKRIRFRSSERRALVNSGARMFVLVSGNARGEELASWIRRHLARMLDLALHEPAPFIAAVNRSGVRVLNLD